MARKIITRIKSDNTKPIEIKTGGIIRSRQTDSMSIPLPKPPKGGTKPK